MTDYKQSLKMLIPKRRANGYKTQKQVAEALDVSVASVARLEAYGIFFKTDPEQTVLMQSIYGMTVEEMAKLQRLCKSAQKLQSAHG